VAPGIESLIKAKSDGGNTDPTSNVFAAARKQMQDQHDRLLNRPAGRENPYLIHQELGNVMTRAATVVRRNPQLDEAMETVEELQSRALRCSLSDTGNWTNQNVVFTKALIDMFPLAKSILRGARLRDECRGAHYKPDFAMPGIETTDPVERRRQAEAWCDRFEENNRKYLKSSIASLDGEGDVSIHYEDVDTSLIEPRPRLYGLVGAEIIEEAWKERKAKRQRTEAPQSPDSVAAPSTSTGKPRVIRTVNT
jgi:succinate dehydrogenase / fumarate reductase flavoprotein subunit